MEGRRGVQKEGAGEEGGGGGGWANKKRKGNFKKRK
jgi:hypothetical protein